MRSIAEVLAVSEWERSGLARLASGRPAQPAPSKGDAAVFLAAAPPPPIGRERELEKVLGILLQEEMRLLTLTDAGGIGKTRMALEAGRRCAGDFPDGVAFVDLAPLRDPELVGTTLAQTLGLGETGAVGGDAGGDRSYRLPLRPRPRPPPTTHRRSARYPRAVFGSAAPSRKPS